jgi:hypothetical protein
MNRGNRGMMLDSFLDDTVSTSWTYEQRGKGGEEELPQTRIAEFADHHTRPLAVAALLIEMSSFSLSGVGTAQYVSEALGCMDTLWLHRWVARCVLLPALTGSPVHDGPLKGYS